MSDNNISRRGAIKALASAGTITVAGQAAADQSNSKVEKALKNLIKRHGQVRVGRGWFVDNNGGRIVDTRGNKGPAFNGKLGENSIRFIQPLEFEDGFRTTTETRLLLSSDQRAAIMAQGKNPTGVVTLVNEIEGKEFRETFPLEEFREQSKRAVDNLQWTHSHSTSSAEPEQPKRGSGVWYTSTSDDGTEDIDPGIPIANAVGANYKTNDNRCGVAQRSLYLTINASAEAEVYATKDFSDYNSNAEITFDGHIAGVISSIGMGGYVRAEGFVRNESAGMEDSVLLMDANVGIAEIPWVTEDGDVNESYGPGDGPVGDDPYLDYKMTTDIPAGTVEAGVRMTVAFNGLKGGVTQTNFMPKEHWFQPANLGTKYHDITVNY